MDGSTLLRCGAELAAVCYQTGLGTAAAPQNAAFIVAGLCCAAALASSATATAAVAVLRRRTAI